MNRFSPFVLVCCFPMVIDVSGRSSQDLTDPLMTTAGTWKLVCFRVVSRGSWFLDQGRKQKRYSQVKHKEL
ncbi:MAG: hypothetical protein CME31_23385 [Gimesia sp.]|uniref:Uncharacterized protein n=1 Tax=Gimesia maris TaxID=122 RepID=A0A3D3RC99_9PLAN|nr:hypothetical protein [Gimesia sp.]HCO25712.1 hypothetical protein [Gimesia maris]